MCNMSSVLCGDCLACRDMGQWAGFTPTCHRSGFSDRDQKQPNHQKSPGCHSAAVVEERQRQEERQGRESDQDDRH